MPRYLAVVAGAKPAKVLATCENDGARFAAAVLACPDGIETVRTCPANAVQGRFHGPPGTGPWPLCAIEIATPTSEAAMRTDQKMIAI